MDLFPDNEMSIKSFVTVSFLKQGRRKSNAFSYPWLSVPSDSISVLIICKSSFEKIPEILRVLKHKTGAVMSLSSIPDHTPLESQC